MIIPRINMNRYFTNLCYLNNQDMLQIVVRKIKHECKIHKALKRLNRSLRYKHTRSEMTKVENHRIKLNGLYNDFDDNNILLSEKN